MYAVNCSDDHDFRLIDVVQDTDSCPEAIEWYVDLEPGYGCLVED